VLLLCERIAHVLFDVGQDFAIAIAAVFVEPGKREIDGMTMTREPGLGDSPRVVARLCGQCFVERVEESPESIGGNRKRRA